MNTVPLFPNFVELAFSHQHLIADLLQSKSIHSSDFGFYNLMGWYFKRPACIARIEDMLIIHLEGPDDTTLFLPPLGKGSMDHALQTLLDFCPGIDCPPGFRYVPKSLQEEILKVFPDAASTPQRSDFDYLYSRKELAELAGRKFHQKKNFVNRVCEEDNPLVEDLGPNNLEEAKRFLAEWYHSYPSAEDTVKLEALAAERMLHQLDKIGGQGILVRIADKIAGISVASPIHRDCWVISLEKADKSIKGVYQFINWALANRLPPEVTLLNRETDLGIEGLRTAKMSYHPVGFEEKFSISFFGP